MYICTYIEYIYILLIIYHITGIHYILLIYMIIYIYIHIYIYIYIWIGPGGGRPRRRGGDCGAYRCKHVSM